MSGYLKTIVRIPDSLADRSPTAFRENRLVIVTEFLGQGLNLQQVKFLNAVLGGWLTLQESLREKSLNSDRVPPHYQEPES